MFRLALSSHIYFFAFRDTNCDTLVFLRSETRAVATCVLERKWVQSTELDTVNRSFCNLCALALWLALHIFATQCWRAPTRAKQLFTVAILLYRFLSCWCVETFFRSISLAVFCLYTKETIFPLPKRERLTLTPHSLAKGWGGRGRLAGLPISICLLDLPTSLERKRLSRKPRPPIHSGLIRSKSLFACKFHDTLK